MKFFPEVLNWCTLMTRPTLLEKATVGLVEASKDTLIAARGFSLRLGTRIKVVRAHKLLCLPGHVWL